MTNQQLQIPGMEDPINAGLDVGCEIAERALAMDFHHDAYKAGYQAGLLQAAHIVWKAFGASDTDGYFGSEMAFVFAALDGSWPSFIKTEVAA
jgi:hypothetical protein